MKISKLLLLHPFNGPHVFNYCISYVEGATQIPTSVLMAVSIFFSSTLFGTQPLTMSADSVGCQRTNVGLYVASLSGAGLFYGPDVHPLTKPTVSKY